MDTGYEIRNFINVFIEVDKIRIIINHSVVQMHKILNYRIGLLIKCMILPR